VSESPIPVALIGCGKIASKHARVLQSIPSLRVAAVCDLDPERARALANEIPGCRVLEGVDAVGLDAEVEVGVVCTPSGWHARHGIALAEAGKHVVVEKPMALRLDEADRLIEICDLAGVKLFVVKQNRCNLAVRKAREAIQSGRMGKIFLGDARVLWNRTQKYYDEEPWRGTWEMDGGVLTNQASHHIDLLLWMMGEVESVFARSRTVGHKIEVEDLGVVLLKFRGGGLGVVEATTCVQPKDREGSLNLYGERGTIEIGGFSADALETWRFLEPTPEDERAVETFGRNPDVFGYSHREFYLNVVETLRSRERALIDGFEGRRSLEVISAIYESIETGAEVHLRFEPRLCRLGVPPA